MTQPLHRIHMKGIPAGPQNGIPADLAAAIEAGARYVVAAPTNREACEMAEARFREDLRVPATAYDPKPEIQGLSAHEEIDIRKAHPEAESTVLYREE